MLLGSVRWEALFAGGAALCFVTYLAFARLYANRKSPSTGTDGAVAEKPAGLNALMRSDPWMALLLLFVALGSAIGMYIVGSWLPTVLNGRGMALQTSNIALALFTLGGSVGALLLGKIFTRRNPPISVAVAYLAGALGAAALAWHGASPTILALALAAGLTGYGAHMSLFSIVNILYPEQMRIAAQAMLVVIFRIGGFLGPLLAGGLIWLNVALDHVMLAAALALLGSGALMALLGLRIRRGAARADCMMISCSDLADRSHTLDGR